MKIAERFGAYWVLGHSPSVGPYRFKKDAQEAMRGLVRFYKGNSTFKPVSIGETMETYLKLANIADAYGLWCKDVLKHPDLMEIANLKPEDVDDYCIYKAEEHNRDELRKIEDRWNRPTFKADLKTLLRGHTLRDIILWMGSELWDAGEALRVLKHYSLSIPAEKIERGLKKGAKMIIDLPEEITEEFYGILE